MDTVRISAGKTKMIAHRGVSGLEKENTIPAFVAAGNRSYWGIETDVHRTADGKLILIHDGDLKRLTGGDGRVEETDFDTLRSISLLGTDGVTPQFCLRMPSPEEYLDICKKYDKHCVMELKETMPRETIRQIVDTVAGQGMLEQTVFIGFQFENMTALREMLPDQALQFLFRGELGEELIRKAEAYRFDLDVDHHWLTEAWIRQCHEHGIKVNCWTVNDPEKGEMLATWGVDYITSNILEAAPAGSASG